MVFEEELREIYKNKTRELTNEEKELLVNYYPDDFAICSNCGELINLRTEASITTNCDNIYCGNCMSTCVKFCNECGEAIDIAAGEEVFLYGLHAYCIDCRDEHFYRCFRCDEWIHEYDSYYMSDIDEYWCEDCTDHYAYWDEEEECYCSEEPTGIENPLGVLNYHTKVVPHFYNDTIDKYDSSPVSGVLYLGAEIEIENKHCVFYDDDLVNEGINDMNHFIYCEKDGSLNYGYENITQPATLIAHKLMKSRYINFMTHKFNEGYRGHNAFGAGLHVHASRDFWDYQNEVKYMNSLLNFIKKNWTNIQIFSRRTKERFNHYAKDLSNLDTTRVVDKWHSLGHDTSHDNRYYAINLTNDHTIEFRFFNGTLSWDCYLAALILVDKLMRLAKSGGLETMTWSRLMNSSVVLRKYWKKVNAIKIHQYITDDYQEIFTEEEKDELDLPFEN